MSNKIFADGLSFFLPREGAPDFVLGTISVQPEKFNDFLKKSLEYVNASGYLYLSVKKSKENGRAYVEIDTYKKPDISKEEAQKTKETVYPEGYPSPDLEGINPDDIPF